MLVAAGSVRHDDMPPGVQNNYQSRENTIQVTKLRLLYKKLSLLN